MILGTIGSKAQDRLCFCKAIPNKAQRNSEFLKSVQAVLMFIQDG
ncbi:hypothetical protein AO385_1529 [Moraxella catarrhalis]|uniref:Uncharacterized protein n=1 Tax=Moraxella catarrhalis TaxID=480 RepID=A0A198URV1_MORCA|nr:hypothetical protein AO383_1812 [Moraxella catarrhalis]OAU98007.1 hypothetical protein AO384_0254 [Moraxella catarrhalis]OAU98903.1 hypothetical protein AO385_1529 [Moraxella catarrhalis]OAV00368.1 hypothetical protein AO382_1518 [Moraxella catarrhalis]